jgi:Spy/CpxP family protein refolding chaperone
MILQCSYQKKGFEMKRKIIAALAAVGLSTTLLAGFAGMKEHHGMHQMKEVMQSLGLSDAQKAELKAMRQNSKSQMQQERENMRLNMAAYFKTEGFDKEGLKNEMRNNMEMRVEARAAKMETIYNLLTPEQRTLFVAKMQELNQ